MSLERLKINQLIADLEAEKRKFEEGSEKKLNELNDIIENAKIYTSNVAVSEHSSFFKSGSRYRETETKKWLVYIRIILIVIALVAIGLIFLALYIK